MYMYIYSLDFKQKKDTKNPEITADNKLYALKHKEN